MVRWAYGGTQGAVWPRINVAQSWNGHQSRFTVVENPKLIERPIVINNNKAVIGRPPEDILTII